MSERERMYQLLDTVPDNKISYIIGYIQGLTMAERDIPNDETISAMNESDEIFIHGTGQRFEGTTEEFMEMLLEG